MNARVVAQMIRNREAKIGILGMGHVGLPTALSLAELGWNVIGADIDSEKLALLRSGHCPFYEPGLQPLLQKHVANSRLTFSDDVAEVIRSVGVLFICVWTSQKASGEADLTHIEELARVIARNLNGYKLIIEKSTVPAGTGQCIKRTIERYIRAGKKFRAKGTREIPPVIQSLPTDEELAFDVASNPEFLQEGRALENILHPDRIVCGTDSEAAEQIIREIYRHCHCPIIVTDLNTSELIKHAANAFLATKISFINMIADLCEAVSADITEIARGIGLDPRIGPGFLNAGIGFGGYCLPKDIRALVYLAAENGVDLALLKEVDRINHQRVDGFLRKVRQAVWVMRGKPIAILGVAFKPETDDIREAPSIRIVEALQRDGAILQIYDPEAMQNFKKLFPEKPGALSYCQSANEAARGAHAVLLLTEWKEFGEIDLEKLRDQMEVPVMIDGRNFLSPNAAKQAGFEYHSMGRESAKAVAAVSPAPAVEEVASLESK